jgi:4a-hydroxytetrahydrobiopterin dehydratase
MMNTIPEALKNLPEWENLAGKAIARTFKFKNYYETMAFVNAVAYIAHRQDHHPDLVVGYNQCRIEYSTHSAGGLTENDIAAARAVDALSA